MHPTVDEMFWAEKGAGAFLNERRLRVSARRDLKEAVFATGIPFAAVEPRNRLAFARTLGTLMPQVAGIRRFGAAALDLAWVAAGRYDGFWELGLKPWDMAAGLLIVREAGGYTTDPHGRRPPRAWRRGGGQPASAPRAARGRGRWRRRRQRAGGLSGRKARLGSAQTRQGPSPWTLIL